MLYVLSYKVKVLKKTKPDFNQTRTSGSLKDILDHWSMEFLNKSIFNL